MSERDLDYEYEIRSKIPDLDAVMQDYVDRSEVAAQLPNARLDLEYGPDPRHRLDLFVPERSDAPVQLFFHGGYWCAGSKEERRFPAEAWIARGMAWATVEYSLAPDASLDQIVDDCRRAIAWFHKHADAYGCDPNRIAISGNSAGGHIVGMLAADGWQDGYDLPRDVVKAVCGVSGLYELEPLRHTFVNEWLGLDEAAARRNSPLRRPPRAGLPMLFGCGGRETAVFREQTEAYADVCRLAGAQVSVLVRPDTDHMRIIGDYAEPESELFQAIEACWRHASLL